MSVFSSRFCRVFLLVFSALRQIPEIVTSSIAEGFAGVAIRWRVTSELRGYCPSAIQAASDLLDPVKRPPTTTIYPRLFAASQQDAETAANEREVLLWLPLCLVRMVLPTCGRTPVGVRFFNFFFILFFKLFFCFFTLRKTLHLNTSSLFASSQEIQSVINARRYFIPYPLTTSKTQPIPIVHNPHDIFIRLKMQPSFFRGKIITPLRCVYRVRV